MTNVLCTLQAIDEWVNKWFWEYKEPNIYYWIYELCSAPFSPPSLQTIKSPDSRTFLWHPISFNQLARYHIDKKTYTPDKMFCQISDHLEYWNRFEWTMLSATSNWWWVINLMFLSENIRLLCKIASWRRRWRCGRFW